LYSIHCRLAKFRGLMIRSIYGVLIGRKARLFVCAQLRFPDWDFKKIWFF